MVFIRNYKKLRFIMFRLVPPAALSLLSVTELSVVKGRVVAEALLSLLLCFLLEESFCVTKSWPVTAPGSQGVFRGRGRGFGFLKNGRQAAIVLSWLLLVQLPGQVLRSYSSKVSKSKRFLIVKQILVYSVTAKLSTEQYLVVRYWFTRMR
jgi:hypothetical protein